MIIATFTSGNRTLIGCKDSKGEKLIKIIDSRLLYENPDKFQGRFLSTISHLFGINELHEDTTLVFAISGNLDIENKKIIKTYLLNNISSSKLFNGFSFVKAFDKIIKKENIFLVNDSDFIALSMQQDYGDQMEYPSLVLFIDGGVSVSIIKKTGIIKYRSAIRPIKHLGNNTADYLLCNQGIDDVLFENKSNVPEMYTLNLAEIVNDIIKIGKMDEFDFKQIFIVSNKSEFIVEKQLLKNVDNNKLYFFSRDKIDSIITKGIDYNKHSPYENSAAQLVESYLKNNRIVKVEYYSSNNESICTLKSFKKFVKHWDEAKPMAYGKNYYKIFYQDDTQMKVYLDSLNSITDLQRYKF